MKPTVSFDDDFSATGVLRCPISGRDDLRLVLALTEKPPTENDFDLSPYCREIWISESTGHMVNRTTLDRHALYDGAYSEKLYASGSLKKRFEAITALPHAQSDNRQRAAWVADRLGRPPFAAMPSSGFDVGSGLGVFGVEMAARGFRMAVQELDPRFHEHLADRPGLTCMVGELHARGHPDGKALEAALGRFGPIGFASLNKVLEHVHHPDLFLRALLSHLPDGAALYVEVPDGEAALCDARNRQELFIEHVHGFSVCSLSLLGRNLGLRLESLERVHEPSGKYTLRSLWRRDPLTPQAG